MKALEKLLKKYEIQLMNLKENKKIDKSDINYPYDFDIKRTKEFIADLKRVLGKVASTDSKLNIDNVNASTSIECTDGEHHFYEVYFVNSDKEPFELDCIKCIECGKIDTDI